MKNKFFTLYSHCRTVEGRDFSIILDLQRVCYTKIPPFLREILFEYIHMPVSQIVKLYQDQEGYIMDCLNYLEKDQFGFFTDNIDSYTPINLTCKAPGTIHNAILEIADIGAQDYGDIIGQLEELNCLHFEIWLEGKTDLGALRALLEPFNERRVESFDLLLSYDKAHTKDALVALRTACHKINVMMVYGAPEDGVDTDNLILFKKDPVEDLKEKSARPGEELSINLAFYIEALFVNPFHSQKVAIGKDGSIHNSMASEKSYGNVKEQRIRDVVMGDSARDVPSPMGFKTALVK